MTFKAAAGVIIYCRGSVILCKRISTYKGEKVPYGGYWSPFAGIIEEGENPQDAAIRELKEESGIISKKEDLEYIGSFNCPERFFTLYALKLEEFPKIELCEEHTDSGFFVVEYLEQLPSDYKLDPDVIKAIQEYEKNLLK